MKALKSQNTKETVGFVTFIEDENRTLVQQISPAYIDGRNYKCRASTTIKTIYK